MNFLPAGQIAREPNINIKIIASYRFHIVSRMNF